MIERDIRPFTTGRKNWLFSSTVAGANASAVIYSIMLTCRACGVEPYAYLRHELTELPGRADADDIRIYCRSTTQPSRRDSKRRAMARCSEISAYE